MKYQICSKVSQEGVAILEDPFDWFTSATCITSNDMMAMLTIIKDWV